MYVNQIDAQFLTPAGIDGDAITHFFVAFHDNGAADVYTDYNVVVEA
jgi:hypothetical protein